MERKTLKQFHKELSWSTRMYTLLTCTLIVSAQVFDAWNTNWVLTIIVALAVLFFVESFSISLHRHPKTWRIIRWVVILIILMILFIG